MKNLGDMKIDWIKSLLAVSIAALIAYGLYAFAISENNKILLGIASFVLISITSVFTFGVKLKEPRVSMMFKTLSLLWWLLAIVINVTFAFFNFPIPLFVIVDGLAIVLYVVIGISICRTQS
jgi:hypothetical protein